MITMEKLRYWKCSHKFGVLIPMLIREAWQLNDKTGTDLW